MKIKILDNILIFWENVCLLNNMYSRLCIATEAEESYSPIFGAYENFNDLRDHLIKTHDTDFNHDLFAFPSNEKEEDIRKNSLPLLEVPRIFHNWVKNSRRVYGLTEELKQLLLATSLKDLCWGDINFPFENFMIQLEKPFIHNTGRYSLICFDRDINEFGEKYLTINMYSDGFHSVRPVPKEKISKFNRSFSRGAYKKAYSILGSLANYSGTKGYFQKITLKDSYKPEILVLDSIKETFNSQMGDNVSRIIVGLCLYLKSLSPNSSCVSSWNKIVVSKKQRNVVQETEICEVSSHIKLDIEEISELAYHNGQSSSGYEVKCHFREGHWRRSPGKGDDPTAPKDVWVRPTIVRKDRKLIGSLPSGAIKS